MNLEIFPQILFFIKFIVGAVAAVALLVVVLASIEHYANRHLPHKKKEMKGHIVTGLIAIVIALVAYGILSAIGPAFRLLFLGRL